MPLATWLFLVFDMKEPATREEICDKIKMHRTKYQTEELKGHGLKKLDDDGVMPSRCANQCQNY